MVDDSLSYLMVIDYVPVLLYDSLQLFLVVPGILVQEQQILMNAPTWLMVDDWMSVMVLHSSC